MSTGTIVVVAAIIAWVIVRQLAGEPLRAARLIGSPVVLTVIDVATGREPGPTAAGIVLIAAGLVIAGVIGVLQGRRMRLESRRGLPVGPDADLGAMAVGSLLRRPWRCRRCRLCRPR
jgi:hypothetical protein